MSTVTATVEKLFAVVDIAPEIFARCGHTAELIEQYGENIPDNVNLWCRAMKEAADGGRLDTLRVEVTVTRPVRENYGWDVQYDFEKAVEIARVHHSDTGIMHDYDDANKYRQAYVPSYID